MFAIRNKLILHGRDTSAARAIVGFCCRSSVQQCQRRHGTRSARRRYYQRFLQGVVKVEPETRNPRQQTSGTELEAFWSVEHHHEQQVRVKTARPSSKASCSRFLCELRQESQAAQKLIGSCHDPKICVIQIRSRSQPFVRR
jgi:hypothetical protein